ncbi:UDP-3-O-[3-hydroxymyristoyl] glucosamine N-acyltransferase [Pseudoalteromonas luteoviolacea B = ATCC 29581]|nr:UDP-3-O-[3-hydroxymyristoyl] glucosamine N-acyltransferase [Pseudoalteromonas luteoviolacea B = ATCC 29581]
MIKQYTLGELAQHIDAQVQGDSDFAISKIATLATATGAELAFLANKKYRAQLSTTQAGAVILAPDEAEYFSGNKLVTSDPYTAYALIAQLLDSTPSSANGIHPSAVIANDAKISPTAHIGVNAVIESGAEVGDNVEIGANCFVGKYAKIASRTKLWANVSVYHEVEIGEDCLFQSGAVIGSDGFGYANKKGRWIKIPQVGRVVIGDRVEVGANTVIDRGALDDTIIHDDVIIDNLCQIAHNVEIGQGTAIAGATVVAGSTKIGKYCQIAGMVGINGHLEICDGVMLTGMTMVTKSINEPGVYSSGMPHTSNQEWRKNTAYLRNLSDFKSRIKALEVSVKQLKHPE